MRRIIVLGFVSPLHKDRLPAIEGIDRVISSTDELRGLSINDAFVVALILSGGVSRLVREFAEDYGLRRLLLVSHPGLNSLASALDTRALLSEVGIDSGVLHLEDLGHIDHALRIARAIASILGIRVALLGVGVKDSVARTFEDRFEARVDAIPMESLEEIINNADERVATEFMNYIRGRVKFEVSDDRLRDVGRIYAAMRGLYGKYDALTINCFPYLIKHKVTPCLALARLNEEGLIVACEADLRALFSMVIARELTGYSGWIANTNHIEGSKVTMAHCTIALSMISDARVVTHFESGFSYGLTGKLLFNEVTGVSVSSDFRRMSIFNAKVVESGLLSNSMCRTQAILDLGVNSSVVLRLAPYNHHVIIPDNVIKELETIAGVLGMEVVKYTQ
ncbi:MAG: fucose isomerase [Vulcanisaeta sp.]|jgi:L-fucose isomerase-like protein|uniref:fucose isomerase n=1 Tax=Vulcanisaeta sp. TaxID=2020871 RepID=UPI003D13BBE8